MHKIYAMKEMKKLIVLYLKGLLMGICDLIPGISGGTIAFITGIYSKLINSVKSISPQLAVDFFRDREKFKKGLKEADLFFLINLGAGIATAMLLGSRFISFLLDNYFTYTIAFFSGLIIASSKIIFNNIENRTPKNTLFALIGIILGGMLALLIPVQVEPNHAYYFLGGFFSVSAMFLPGISGAFILLIMGLYEFLLEILKDIPGHLDFFLVSVLGAALGAFFISRVISFLFKKDKCKTLYVLLGLVIGSLIIPLRRIYEETTQWSIENCFLLVLFFILGITAAVIVSKLQKKTSALC